VSGLVHRLLDGALLTEGEAGELFGLLTDPATPPGLAGAALGALRVRGARPAEVLGLARALRAAARPCRLASQGPLVDVVGTGGDASSSFNLSTGSAILAAACGLSVAKHGTGAQSGRSGSADVIEALGLPLPLTEEEAGALLSSCGFTFLHAPHYHPALAAVGPLRRSLGTRTVFNLLGPLANPAAPAFAVIGAWSLEAARAIAETISALPIERAFVVHGENGWDEPTPVGPFTLLDVRPGRVAASERDPEDLGLARCGPEALTGGDATTNAAALRRVLEGERGAHRDALLLGASLALEVTRACETPREGIERAAAAIDAGRAAAILDTLAAFRPRRARTAHV
jgi:anthranilate phosphoribosyltransferase